MTDASHVPQAFRRFVSLLAKQAAREVVNQRWMTTGTETTAAVRLPDSAPVAIATST